MFSDFWSYFSSSCYNDGNVDLTDADVHIMPICVSSALINLPPIPKTCYRIRYQKTDTGFWSESCNPALILFWYKILLVIRNVFNWVIVATWFKYYFCIRILNNSLSLCVIYPGLNRSRLDSWMFNVPRLQRLCIPIGPYGAVLLLLLLVTY